MLRLNRGTFEVQPSRAHDAREGQRAQFDFVQQATPSRTKQMGVVCRRVIMFSPRSSPVSVGALAPETDVASETHV